jgi:hypothetical protein
LADPTGTSSTLADSACGGGSTQVGAPINSPEQMIQLSAEVVQVSQVSPHGGHSASPST